MPTTSITKCVLILAGGTGGHIIPALAVAKALQEHNIEIHWLGTEKGLEHQLIPPTGIPIHYIKAKGIRGKGIKGLFAAPFRMLRATLQAHHIIRKLKPSVVVGFGGYVSAPGGLAAWLQKIPLIVHEQNSIAGMSNRFLALLATQVFQAFPDTFALKRRAITCGNPVRADILALPNPEQRFQQRNHTIRLLILGGSQGAAIFNQILPTTLANLSSSHALEIWHSSGKGAAEKTLVAYQQAGITARVVDFIQTMPEAYAWADLVICRAGALTIAELTAAGVGSILIPYPHAVDDHQTKNSAFLVKSGAAILIQQHDIDPQKLRALLIELITDRALLLSMASAARSLAMPESTQKVVQRCLELC